jgi:predicted permease
VAQLAAVLLLENPDHPIIDNKPSSSMNPAAENVYNTFMASLRSVGTAVTLASVGVYLHRRGFVVGDGKRVLAVISQQVTFPLFLFTKIIYCNQDWSDDPCPDVAKTLHEVWMLLLWPAYVVGIGLLVGALMARMAGTPPAHVRSVLAACAFGNSTGLAITLLTVVHSNFPETSDLGRIDPTLFLSVYLLLYPILQWGLGGWLLAPPPECEVRNFLTETAGEEGDTSTETSSGAAMPLNDIDGASDGDGARPVFRRSLSSNVRVNVLNLKEVKDRLGLTSMDEGLYISEHDLSGFNFPDTEGEHASENAPLLPNDSAAGSYTHSNNANPSRMVVPVGNTASTALNDILLASQQNSSQENTLECYGAAEFDRFSTDDSIDERVQRMTNSFPTTSPASDPTTTANRVKTLSNSKGETVWSTVKNILSRCFQPPVIGAVAGIICAVTPLRGIFVDLVDRSADAPMEWLFDGLHNVGMAAVPINMMILGCNLSASQMKDHTLKHDPNMLSMRTMIWIVIGKMIIMPIIGILSAIILKLYVWDIPKEIHGSFYLVLMIVFLTPTSNNVMVMVELSRSDTKEGIASVIALQYAVAPLILSLTMTIAIGIASDWS